MRIPTATYRIQFNSAFGFENAHQIISYLSDLGISDFYASPIFKARAGSTHGYDVVDANQINPELGTEETFDYLINEVKKHGMGWLQDIVPNHMAYDSENQLLMDVLEHGPDSDYTDYFDIIWNAPNADRTQPILAPLLGDFYGDCLDKGEIQLQYAASGLSVNYYGLKLPLKLESYAQFLTHNLGQLTRSLGRNHPDFVKLLGILYILKTVPSEVTGKQRQDQISFVKGILWDLYDANPEIKAFVDQNIIDFNGEPGRSESFNLLNNLLSEQFFRLTFWKVGAEEINYRRFFTVNELISMKVEELKVFNATHGLIFKLVESGTFTGLRIDHIDGLYNPTQYLDRLRQRVGDNLYITVEKILELTEDLLPNWPIQGATGYEFLNYANGIFCQTTNEAQFDEIYAHIAETRVPYAEMVTDKKHLILERNLAGDIDNLTQLLKYISTKNRYSNDFTLNGLKRALVEVLIQFPVYRTYINQLQDSRKKPSSEKQHQDLYVKAVIEKAKVILPLLLNELNFIEKVLLLQYEDTLSQTEKDQWLYFVMRLQQYTGPLMAKGAEDTALYVYSRLISLNEVGGNPGHFGVTIDEFHQFNQKRQTNWNHTMNATATHDTKRGEDVRARLNVLSEIPVAWEKQASTWSAINHAYRTNTNGLEMPAKNDEYFFYQTLLGAFPFVAEEYPQFIDRIKDYVIKAVREAKVHSAWLHTNSAYEEAFTEFVDKVLEISDQNQFLREFQPFQQWVSHYGTFNSLAQVLLKLTAPGVPDFYQGTELWDFSLVDPDNRRPVDFEHRSHLLQSLKTASQTNVLSLVQELLNTRTDGRIKLFLIYRVLHFRNQYSTLFEQGKYVPLAVTGKFQDHIVSFARIEGTQMAIVVVPRLLTSIVQPEEDPLSEKIWGDTQIELPQNAPPAWQEVICAEPEGGDSRLIQAIEGKLAVSTVLQHFPVGLLISRSAD